MLNLESRRSACASGPRREPGLRSGRPGAVVLSLIVLPALLLPLGQTATRSQGVSSPTSPLQQFGARIGDDYFLATYEQLEQYWRRLDRESERMQLVDIGRTEEGRTQWMAVVSAPENLARLDRYREISRRLALAEGLSDDDAVHLAREGRAVVWIDGGQHADEVLTGQQLIELVYRLVSGSDEETERLLRDVIVLAVHANPDGHELVSRWYMREADPRRRSLAGLPRLYQKYAGHDNNRDFYLVSQAETINMSRVLYREWFPQIVYNHHQTAPEGTVMFAPPFRDPFNYVFDPLVPATIELVGAAMQARFLAEGKGGVTQRDGAPYSAWWNGGLRTTAYFHNQIGLLTETLGGPTPVTIPFVAERQLPSTSLPLPIQPGLWRFRQAVEYSMTANLAVLDVASRYREALLLNSYRMASNAIRRGQEDTWTAAPRRLGAASAFDRTPAAYARLLRDPDARDPRGYILPSNQPDFPTAVKFVRSLLRSGVAVHRATRDFTVAGRPYPAGSYLVRTAQAFRPHVLDMFEPQDHPGDTGAPPYDSTGWTLAFQMGVAFDRVLDAFDGPFVRVEDAEPPAAAVADAPRAVGFYLSPRQNDSAIVINRLLAAGERVSWLLDGPAGEDPQQTGALYVEGTPRARTIIESAAATLGISAAGASRPPRGRVLRLRPPRIALWDQYGGSAASGWIRWILERFEFPFELVYPPALDAGALAGRFDVLILPSDAVFGKGGQDQLPAARVPPEYRPTLGAMTRERTLPRLREFVAGGGTLVAMGQAAAVGAWLGLPISAVRLPPDGADPFDVPGAILRVSVDPSVPPAFGLGPRADVVFNNNPVFALHGDAADLGVRRLAWFESAGVLRSGWGRGLHLLAGRTAALEAPLGAGRVLLFGPEITFRGQPHGTFRFLFNSVFYSAAEPAGPAQAPAAENLRDARPGLRRGSSR